MAKSPKNLAKIAKARMSGCKRSLIAWDEAERAGIPYYVLCAYLEQESSGGDNVFGHDAMKCGDEIKGQRVTKSRYEDYKKRRSTCGMQGVGPMQLTFHTLQDAADELGGCWKPRINIRYGAKLIADYQRESGSWHAAAKRYNGSEEYAIRNDDLRHKWAGLLKEKEEGAERKEKKVPKKSLVEMNQRIDAKLKNMEGDRAERERARKVVDKEDARLDEVRTELKRARELLDRRRAIAKEVREDLKREELEQELDRLRVLAGEAPEEPPPTDMDADDQEVAKLGSRLDDLSGLIEDGLATRDRLLEKLDRLRESEAEAEKALTEALEERKEDREALERMRARRKRIEERQDRPSAHFAYAEFDCNNGQKLPKEAEPSVKDWCERIGEPLRKRFGPVQVNSGYRPTAYNASVGGEPNSVHIYDYPGRNFRAVAVDVTCANGSPSEWYAFTAGKADGRGTYSTFHHADTRSRIGWPDATWSG